VIASQDVAGFGLIGFGDGRVKRLASQDLKKGEMTTLTAQIDFNNKDWDGIGISNYNVPLETAIDLVDIRITKQV